MRSPFFILNIYHYLLSKLLIITTNNFTLPMQIASLIF